MGLLRILLAAMVIFVHAGPLPAFPTMGGSLAVQTFYIISGFYMALILNEKYVHQCHPYRLFIINRILRLLPIYYVVFSLTLLTAIVMVATLGEPKLEFFRALRDSSDQLSPWTSAYLIVTNLTLIGQDWLSFLTIDPEAGTLVFTSNFTQSGLNLNSFLIVQPAWTVSLELMFYMVAPFIVRRRTWVLLSIMLVSIGIRYVLRHYGHLYSMAWSYRFFPSELLYFVGGVLAYKGYRQLKTSKLPSWLYPLSALVVLMYTLFFGLFHQWLTDLGCPDGISSALYRLTIGVSLPFLFAYTKNSHFDNRIGDLSYPLYIVHFLVWETLSAYAIGGAYSNLYTLAIALAIAYTINRLVGEPIERVRQRVFSQQSAIRPSLA
ncbi:acyltransferase family protein [Fibrivirga algicola]|uniref:Acyltransferase n=1 Tax=Fibrivirga algicola TaxID=2950420 RepID=A0ABX0QA24_9BACT|nr:acyltransferase [Fibrivirga algicola]NID08776.1 acyltransferase [Fibrivirga algicola]